MKLKLTLLSLILTLVSCGNNAVNVVKKGSFSDIQGVTVGDLFDKRFEDGDWSSEKNNIGQTIVTFKGKTLPYRGNIPTGVLNDYDFKLWFMSMCQTVQAVQAMSVLKGVASWDDVAQRTWPVGSEMTITFLITDVENKTFELNTCDAPQWPLGCHGNQFSPYLRGN